MFFFCSWLSWTFFHPFQRRDLGNVVEMAASLASSPRLRGARQSGALQTKPPCGSSCWGAQIDGGLHSLKLTYCWWNSILLRLVVYIIMIHYVYIPGGAGFFSPFNVVRVPLSAIKVFFGAFRWWMVSFSDGSWNATCHFKSIPFMDISWVVPPHEGL